MWAGGEKARGKKARLQSVGCVTFSLINNDRGRNTAAADESMPRFFSPLKGFLREPDHKLPRVFIILFSD